MQERFLRTAAMMNDSRKSIVGKKKAFGIQGPMWKVTVGAVNADPSKFTHVYRDIFMRQGKQFRLSVVYDAFVLVYFYELICIVNIHILWTDLEGREENCEVD